MPPSLLPLPFPGSVTHTPPKSKRTNTCLPRPAHSDGRRGEEWGDKRRAFRWRSQLRAFGNYSTGVGPATPRLAPPRKVRRVRAGGTGSAVSYTPRYCPCPHTDRHFNSRRRVPPRQVAPGRTPFQAFFSFCCCRDLRPASVDKNQEAVRMRLYEAYAWGGPLVIAGVAAALDHLPAGQYPHLLRPGFGYDKCWFKGKLPPYF